MTRRLRSAFYAAMCAIPFPCLAATAPGTPLHALLVGGGPDRENNTAQIEEHLRFVAGLVPPSPGRVVLFADGKADSRDLSYTDSSSLTQGQQALDVLLPNDGLGAAILTRSPSIGAPIDGPSRLFAIDRGVRRLAALSGRTAPPVLLYFAGHGSQSEGKSRDSLYNLWGEEDLDPGTLLREINTLPPRVPVMLVMAQCFSGGFASVIFRKANPDLGVNDRLVAGFFASESDREAAGCGTETNSPLYQDFSSYFFGALSGRDRLGHRVTGADFDGDGRVSCHEAWCYALIHDDSIDTPVCTSLIFLRRYSEIPDEKVFSANWQGVLDSATPAERAVLQALSDKLGLGGDHRILTAFDRLMFSDPVGQPGELHAYRDAEDRLNALRMTSLENLFGKFPALRWRDSTNHEYQKATRAAAADLGKDPAECQFLLTTREAFDRADATLDSEEALLVRFTDVAELVVRARYLDGHADNDIKSRFSTLWRMENQSLPLKTAQQP